MTFHRFNVILSGAATALTLLIMFAVQINHAVHFTNYSEQRKIMNISLLIPIYSVIAFLSLCFPNAYVYLFPWTDFFQSIALGTFFLLMAQYVFPSKYNRDVMLQNLEIAPKKSSNGSEPEPVDGLQWYKVSLFTSFILLRSAQVILF